MVCKSLVSPPGKRALYLLPSLWWLVFGRWEKWVRKREQARAEVWFLDGGGWTGSCHGKAASCHVETDKTSDAQHMTIVNPKIFVGVGGVSAIFVAVVVQKERRKTVVDDGSPANSEKILLSEHFAENKVSQEKAAVESKCKMVCDFDFTSSGSASRSGAGSDCSLTDDENDGLIEIAFQEGAPIPLINEEKCQNSRDISKCPDVFSDDGVLTDDEMEEEDNLIELDISMGSIKLPMVGPEIEQQQAL